MLDIKIIAVGKIKFKPWHDAAAEYILRLKPYTRVTVCELVGESFSEKDNKTKVKKAEGEKIIKELAKTPEADVYLLTENGSTISSVDLATKLGKLPSKIIFVVGGTLGLSDDLLKGRYKKMSLSPLTFTHELARVILLEQLYRATTIINQKSYHY